MHSIQIGSLVLNGQLILVLSFGVAGWLALRYGIRNFPDKSWFLSCVTNAFWLWVIVWKASFLLFHPMEAVQQPVSILYFDGGERGRWVASLVSAAYIWWKGRKRHIPLKQWFHILVPFFFAGWTSTQVLLFVFGEEPGWLYAASAGFSSVLLTFYLLSSKGSDSPNGLAFAIWFSIGHVAIWFLVPERTMWFLSFSKQQTIFLLAAVCMTGWAWLEEKAKKGGHHG